MSAPADRSVPTVVVARTPQPGREREFEGWLRRLAAAAGQAPGHVRTDVQAPDDAHPGEWVIVYRFDDVASLHAWLTSATRDELIAEGRDLLLGDAREQVLALPVEHEAVTAVASFRVRPGFEERHAAALERLLARLRRAPGFVRSEVFEPVAGVQDETVVVFAFDGREHLDEWLASPARREALAEIDELVEGGRTVNVVGGFGGWFGGPGSAEVKRWKQALVVLIALFPTSLVLAVLRGWLLPDAGLVLGVLFGNVLGVIILSWLLMPVLTELLAEWLRR